MRSISAQLIFTRCTINVLCIDLYLYQQFIQSSSSLNCKDHRHVD